MTNPRNGVRSKSNVDRLAPCRARPAVRRFQRVEVEKTLSQDVTVPALTEWAGPIVFATMKNGSFRFCVDNRTMRNFTRRDLYSIPNMEKESTRWVKRQSFPLWAPTADTGIWKSKKKTTRKLHCSLNAV